MSEPIFIKGWKELSEIPQESETHRLEIDLDMCCGYIYPKNDPKNNPRHYLSTHTFYGHQHKGSTRMLRECGFNVTIANWDEEE